MQRRIWSEDCPAVIHGHSKGQCAGSLQAPGTVANRETHRSRLGGRRLGRTSLIKPHNEKSHHLLLLVRPGAAEPLGLRLQEVDSRTTLEGNEPANKSSVAPITLFAKLATKASA